MQERPTSTRLGRSASRSEEHTSELQSRENLVCRLLLEKKNTRLHSLRTLPSPPPRPAHSSLTLPALPAPLPPAPGGRAVRAWGGCPAASSHSCRVPEAP